jgi:hypothetical protein
VHTLFGSFLPSGLISSLSPQPRSLPGRTCAALFYNFVGEDISNNKKDKAFLLVEIKIAIQRDFKH